MTSRAHLTLVAQPGPRSFDVKGPLPTGTTLLEASAGTGKTWTIASLVTRYVAEGVCRLDELLVVTFGRAASEELRERVREQLVAAEDALAGGAPVDRSVEPLVPLLTAGSPADVAARRRRVRDALSDFDSATIATTHQFCQLVLTGLGVAGDTDAGARLVEDLDDLVLEVVDDLYVRGFAGTDGAPAFSHTEARSIARAAVGDPQATLQPNHAGRETTEGRRRSFADAVRGEFERRKRRLGVLSYDDLLGQLADALADDDAPARARMRQRWKVVLVDEFQDTDPVQWAVLERAFHGVATLVLIGDPKQAIYAFRGGDVVTYLAAAAAATSVATLSTNHRTDAPLLAATQAVLGGAALGDERIVVREVDAAHGGSRLRGAPHPDAFRLRVVERDTFGISGRKGVPVAALRDHVAADLAGDVASLLAAGATFEGRPLEARHVAVLCDTRRQCGQVADALRTRGVRAVVGGSGTVFASEAARHWLALLEAMEQPHVPGRVRAAGLTPFLGRSVADLDEGGDELTEADAETLRTWAETMTRRGVGAVLEMAGADGRLAARVLGRPGGERAMTDLRHAAELLHEASADIGPAPVGLAAWLRRAMAEDLTTISPERARRLDSDATAVQVLTVHASKGMQFPVVYLPTLCDTYPQRPAFPLYHDEEGRRCLDVGGGGADRAPAGTAVDAAMAEEAGEELRLLYVAVTRAQSQVVTWWLPSARNTEPSALHRMLFGRDPGEPEVPDSAPLVPDDVAATVLGRWQEAGGPVVERSQVAPAVAVPGERPGGPRSVRRFTRRVDRDWTRTSYTGLAREAEHVAAVPPSTSEPEDPGRDDEAPLPAAPGDPSAAAPRLLSPMAGLPVGTGFGSLVHAVLENADPSAPRHGGDWRSEVREQVDLQLVRWPVELDADALTDALVAACDTPLGPLADVTLRDVGRRDRLTELGFELPLAGGDAAVADAPAAVLRDVASLWRAHVPDDDPLAGYADTLDQPAYGQVLRGYLSGSLDLVLRHGGRYLVADYKTNWLGDPDRPLYVDAFAPARLGEAMCRSSYPLQALLYSVVLHRFLRGRLQAYRFAEHVGGVLYLYLRGMAGPATPVLDGGPCGVFSWRPRQALVESVSDLLDGEVTR